MTLVVPTDYEMAILSAGAVIVKRTHAYVYVHRRVTFFVIEKESHVAHSNVDLPCAGAPNSVEVEVAFAQVEFTGGARPHGHDECYGRMRFFGELELNDAVVRLDTKCLDVVCKIAAR